jgi:hypothetical protein
MQHTTEATKQYQCRHIFTDGRRCASPCLRQQEFCYYHHTTRKPVADPGQRRSRRSTFYLALPEDRSAIQASIGQVLQRIAANEIDPRRAGLLLYGLQIASLNLPKIQTPNKSAAVPQTVEEITIDPELGVLAPRAEVSKATERKSTVAKLIERIMQEEPPAPFRHTRQTEQQPAPIPEPATIPTLQATADPDVVLRSCRHPERSEGSRRDRSRLGRLSISAKDASAPTINSQKRHFDRPLSKRSEPKGQWRNPLLHLSPSHSLAITRGSYTPYPPAHRAYKRSFQSHPASDHPHESHIRGRRSPYSWSRSAPRRSRVSA